MVQVLFELEKHEITIGVPAKDLAPDRLERLSPYFATPIPLSSILIPQLNAQDNKKIGHILQNISFVAVNFWLALSSSKSVEDLPTIEGSHPKKDQHGPVLFAACDENISMNMRAHL